MPHRQARPRVAEFFAGIGLVRLGLENVGLRVVFANDISPVKQKLYAANFGDRDFVLGDIRDLKGGELPHVELATGSFPCTDLSLAGNRRGLAGPESGLIFELIRVIGEMGRNRPRVILLENVPGFVNSNAGKDLAASIAALNGLGYSCDPIALDARSFVPQSRMRLFIVAVRNGHKLALEAAPRSQRSTLRPPWIRLFIKKHPSLLLHGAALPEPPVSSGLRLSDIVERFPENDPLWWNSARLQRFLSSLAPVHAKRLNTLMGKRALSWATTYRRTRNGRSVWEIRADDISGCLRTTRGGSSKQALVEACQGQVRVRWMTAREYARLQGADDLIIADATEGQVRFGLGDAVCVPAITWLSRHYILPILTDQWVNRECHDATMRLRASEQLEMASSAP